MLSQFFEAACFHRLAAKAWHPAIENGQVHFLSASPLGVVMRISVALVLFFLLVAPVPAAELRTLDGKVLKGELTAADEKNVMLRTEGGAVAVPVLDVLQIELVAPGDLPSPSQTKDPYLDVELTDGSLFHCRSIACKGKSLE